MARNRLRVYFGPELEATSTDSSPSETGSATSQPTASPRSGNPALDALPTGPQLTVTLSLGEMLPTIIDALCRGRGWVEDFRDDKITISRDLYEVLLAYQQQYGRRAG
ncbi:hypothetical protein Psta_0050 [Pirellula staleyi DSM 6068]|uniref:Uncharacterized protein n=1 Tax=Pirellula staleyi (strain ATCC 27377 / DSM 6068 / ICPB 4128) TaxID=530564 RepID=D2QZI9_PIRSD|nr:hypothetical protein [Pirellula staleyi]ADB14747.1 hypothetical protein Psta_0050 [Pirellula staleyi DSM 6068]